MTIQEGGEDAIFVKEPVESCTPPLDSSSSSKPWKGMTPNSEVTTQLSTGRPCDSAGQSFCDGVLWDREDLVKAVRDEQLQCRADVATLQARCSSLERQLQAAVDRIDRSAAACRVPMLVGSQPEMRRLLPGPGWLASMRVGGSACSASAPAPSGTPPPDAADVALLSAPRMLAAQPTQDLLVLCSKVEALEKTLSTDVEMLKVKVVEVQGNYSGSIAKLDAALDAARTGIAGLARDLHYDKEARKKVYSDMSVLAKDVGKQVVGPALKRTELELRAESQKFIHEEVAKLQVAVDSRCQLVLAELRGSVAQKPARQLEFGPRDKEESAPPEIESSGPKTLAHWLPENTDGDVQSCKQMLVQLRVFEHMAVGGSTPDDLVSRPTTRFLHRVVVAIKHATGYPQGILEDWPRPDEAKVDFVQKVWDSVSQTLSLQDLEFRAQDVLRCTNRKQTRRLLQLLAIAASKERGDIRRTPCTALDVSQSLLRASSDLPLSPLPARSPALQALQNEKAATSVCWH
eukprot:CAMPEP_0177200210 /NCGR_PEP_ID=MMETSP0367-20130122/26098_1 /TAXON_ID=447022 ORGANISM="Scrippsiella hangoei-like, Strain SHHI-4" /NCGR_SAMPLE_ID=MMETSP0367 /ASSEMBLY_ACC=CAM_ASM_000362 /LENGTH=516 /DNA_ID=CAMNT_0018648635 /DNA_START=64 /DNA_END=1614 /DNA_ORIENTATION=+